MTAPDATHKPSVQEELDAFLAFSHGGVLLWHDPDATYETTLDGLTLPSDAVILKEDEFSHFSLLRALNEIAPDETVLLYRKRRHRVEDGDWLADVEAYAECFSPTASAEERPTSAEEVSQEVPERDAIEHVKADVQTPAIPLEQDWYACEDFEARLEEAGLALSKEADAESLGFRLYEDCALRTTYDGPADYYRMIFSPGLIARASLPVGLSEAPSFRSFLNGQMAAGRTYDYDADTWIGRAGLEELGITSADLDGFARQAVERAVTNGVPQFTVPWLRAATQGIDLLEYGLEDCFYESVLLSRRRLATRGQLAGRRVFAEPHAQASGRALVASLVGAEQSVDLEVLLDILRNEYGIPLQRSQLVQLTRTTDLFYSPELDRIYVNHDQFVREVE